MNKYMSPPMPDEQIWKWQNVRVLFRGNEHFMKSYDNKN